MGIRILDVNNEYLDYLHDESRRLGRADKIVFPTTTEEVCEALHIATANGWPVTLQGGRTGITGGCVPDGGLILNMSLMNAIGQIKGDRLTVQSGATLSEIRAAIANSALFFPSDLTEITASIGGMVANNASGARSFRYGSVRKWIHALQVVLASGEVVRVERGVQRADGFSFQLDGIEGELPDIPMPDVKTVAGYFVKPDMDLVDLFIGAEGTLGVVTEITIRFLPKPEQIKARKAFFASEAEALQFVRMLRESSSPIAIEFFDSNALELLRRMKADEPAFLKLPALKSEFQTAIYFEYEGDVPDAVVERVESALECWCAEDDCEIEILKKFRHAIPESVNHIIAERKRAVPELTKLGTDMSVPDAQLENIMRIYHEGLAELGLEYVIFGHIGNNHVHVNIMPRTMEEYEAGKAIYLDWAKQVVAMGGSVSAEHGIGKIKTEFLKLMVGGEGIRKMSDLKEMFDPAGLLNTGNLFR